MNIVAVIPVKEISETVRKKKLKTIYEKIN